MKETGLPPLEVLDATFNYNPETGIVTWKNTHWKKRIGERAGCAKSNRGDKKYRFLYVNGERLPEHRIVWVIYHQCDIPEGMVIDHINGDGTDNRIENLRLVTMQQNSFNRDYRHCTNARRGVSRNPKGAPDKQWRARISGEVIGYYATFEEAVEAREQAELQIKEFLPRVM